jgi:dethiobiotin synthetase
MQSYFVTATGTEIGKTYVTAGILRAGRAAGRKLHAIKPLLSGYEAARAADSDPGILLAAMGKRVTAKNIAAIAPWRFAAPLSPDMAAAREARRIEVAKLVDFCLETMRLAGRPVLIEGVGGAAVPLDDTHLVADWIQALSLPALLVAGTYLGTISHTITAAETLHMRGIRIAGIILNESLSQPVPAAETAATLARFLHAPIHIIPRTYNDQSFVALAASL